MSEFEGFNDNITATTTPKRIAGANAKRMLLKIKNNSATVVYLGFKKTVTSTDGFPLGQTKEFKMEKTNGYHGEIWAVTNAGTADVRIMQA